MAEEATAPEEQVNVLRGPDGALYMITSANLDRHRVPDDLAPSLIEAFQGQSEVAGFAQSSANRPPIGSFDILAQGKLPAPKSNQLQPIDTWVDTM